MLRELLEKRQSVRHYKQTPVPGEEIQKCLEAARLAPSACNSQPWHFVVINNPEIKKKFTKLVFNGPYQMNSFVKEAPVIIACVSEKVSFVLKTAGFFRKTPFYLLDIGIAMEHFVLQAEELNLSTCWIGWFDEKTAKKILKIPFGKKIICLLALGYSQEQHREKVRKNLKDICSFNQY